MYQLRILKLATSPTDFQSPNQVPMLSLKPVLINFIAQKFGKQLPYILSFSHSSSSIRDKQSANNTTQRPLHLRKVRSLLSVLFCWRTRCDSFRSPSAWISTHAHIERKRENSLCVDVIAAAADGRIQPPAAVGGAFPQSRAWRAPSTEARVRAETAWPRARHENGRGHSLCLYQLTGSSCLCHTPYPPVQVCGMRSEGLGTETDFRFTLFQKGYCVKSTTETNEMLVAKVHVRFNLLKFMWST